MYSQHQTVPRNPVPCLAAPPNRSRGDDPAEAGNLLSTEPLASMPASGQSPSKRPLILTSWSIAPKQDRVRKNPRLGGPLATQRGSYRALYAAKYRVR